MIQIYKNYKDLNEENIIIDADSFFNGYITSKEFGIEEIDVLSKIDKAELLDKNIGTIKTPRGITSIDNLSTGCKTVLTYIYMLKGKIPNKNAIDISGCGANALDLIFRIAEKQDANIILILRHKDNVFSCEERDYIIDGNKKVKNLAYM